MIDVKKKFLFFALKIQLLFLVFFLAVSMDDWRIGRFMTLQVLSKGKPLRGKVIV